MKCNFSFRFSQRNSRVFTLSKDTSKVWSQGEDLECSPRALRMGFHTNSDFDNHVGASRLAKNDSNCFAVTFLCLGQSATVCGITTKVWKILLCRSKSNHSSQYYSTNQRFWKSATMCQQMNPTKTKLSSYCQERRKRFTGTQSVNTITCCMLSVINQCYLVLHLAEINLQ